MARYATKGQKEAILKWRANNTEKYNDYMNEYHKGYYLSNAEEYRKKRMNYYYYQKECRRLCSIDIIDIIF
jgi:hypothetical protein